MLRIKVLDSLANFSSTNGTKIESNWK